jgi:hypothetical protein
MNLDNNPRFLAFGGTAAGAGIASAIVGLASANVAAPIPIIGGIVAFTALKLFGVLDNPNKVIFDPSRSIVESDT